MSSESTGSDGVKVAKKKRTRRLKVVLRRLPHGMTETDIYEQIEPIPASVSCRWFVPADLELLPFAFSRAYFVFEDELEAMSFCQRFNGYVFVDKLGNESMALAEQAPSPDIPKKEGREHDRRMNTLESDTEYLKFLATYNSTIVKKITDFDGLLREIEEKHRAENFVKPTPLTEFIEARQPISRYDRRMAQNATARANRRAEKVRQNAPAQRGGGGGLPPDAKPKVLARRPPSGSAVAGTKEEQARPGPARERTARGGGNHKDGNANRGGRPRDGNRGGGGGGGGPREETRDEGRHARPAVDDSAASAHPDTATAAETRNPRRRRDRRRGQRDDKPPGERAKTRGGGGSPSANAKGGDGRGGVAVMVLRRLKADVSGGQPSNAKETNSKTAT